MNERYDNYLWDPRAPSDPEIAALERILAPCSARARGVSLKESLPRRRYAKWWIAAPAGIAAAIAVVVFAFYHRLEWQEGAAWPATVRRGVAESERELALDKALITAPGESATVKAARIGKVTVGENSSLRLIQTRKGRHRVELQYGRLHAKIWAPPASFGVVSGSTSFIDMGCEFDLQIERSGVGRLQVVSGWVSYRNGNADMTAPAGYWIAFDNERASTPLHSGASAELREAVTRFDTLVASSANTNELATPAATIASLATDKDYYTLFHLLMRHPPLAEGPLYDRLGAAMQLPTSDENRRGWMAGDWQAREEWWDRLPTQPKRWWVNWRDAF